MRIKFLKSIFSSFIIFFLVSSLPAQESLKRGTPNCLISLASFAIVCDKSAQKVYLYFSDRDSLKLIKSFSCSTGERKGDKFRTGDKKTPEGVYFFTRRRTKRLLPKHGIMAFPLNYPNLIDKRLRKGGSGIWFHGVEKKSEQERELPATKGCVAVRNSDLLELSEIIRIKNTPFVIVDKISYASPEIIKKEREKFNSFTSSWKTAWESKDVAHYLSFYSQDFCARGMDRERWKKYKERVISNKTFIEVEIEDLKILKDGDMIVLSFNQYYSSDRFKDQCKKILYLEREFGSWKIFGEEIL